MKYGIIKDPEFKDIDIEDLVSLLNDIGSENISFNLIEEEYRITTAEVEYESSWDDLLEKFKESNEPFDDYIYIMYITNKRYRYGKDKYLFFSSIKKKLEIVSFYNWDNFTKSEKAKKNSKIVYSNLPKSNGFIYFVCSLLGCTLYLPKNSNKTDDYCKNKNTGCIYDYLNNKGDINNGMKKTRICSDCENKIKRKEQEEYQIIRPYLDKLMKILKDASFNENENERDIIKYWKVHKESVLNRINPNKKKELEIELIEITKEDEKEQDEKVKELTKAKKSKEEIRKELLGRHKKDALLIESTRVFYERDNVAIALIKMLRDFECQICQTTIKKENGELYIEAAHIKAKSDKGKETLDNIILLCPNHHKEFDLGKREIIKHDKKSIEFKLNGKLYIIPLDY